LHSLDVGRGGSTVRLLAALLNRFVPCPCLLRVYVKFPDVKLCERKGKCDKECVATHFERQEQRFAGGRQKARQGECSRALGSFSALVLPAL